MRWLLTYVRTRRSIDAQIERQAAQIRQHRLEIAQLLHPNRCPFCDQLFTEEET